MPRCKLERESVSVAEFANVRCGEQGARDERVRADRTSARRPPSSERLGARALLTEVLRNGTRPGLSDSLTRRWPLQNATTLQRPAQVDPGCAAGVGPGADGGQVGSNPHLMDSTRVLEVHLRRTRRTLSRSDDARLANFTPVGYGPRRSCIPCIPPARIKESVICAIRRPT